MKNKEKVIFFQFLFKSNQLQKLIDQYFEYNQKNESNQEITTLFHFTFNLEINNFIENYINELLSENFKIKNILKTISYNILKGIWLNKKRDFKKIKKNQLLINYIWKIKKSEFRFFQNSFNIIKGIVFDIENGPLEEKKFEYFCLNEKCNHFYISNYKLNKNELICKKCGNSGTLIINSIYSLQKRSYLIKQKNEIFKPKILLLSNEQNDIKIGNRINCFGKFKNINNGEKIYKLKGIIEKINMKKKDFKIVTNLDSLKKFITGKLNIPHNFLTLALGIFFSIMTPNFSLLIILKNYDQYDNIHFFLKKIINVIDIYPNKCLNEFELISEKDIIVHHHLNILNKSKIELFLHNMSRNKIRSKIYNNISLFKKNNNIDYIFNVYDLILEFPNNEIESLQNMNNNIGSLIKLKRSYLNNVIVSEEAQNLLYSYITYSSDSENNFYCKESIINFSKSCSIFRNSEEVNEFDAALSIYFFELKKIILNDNNKTLFKISKDKEFLTQECFMDFIHEIKEKLANND